MTLASLGTTRLRTYLAELHVHTVLSPCAEVEMIPPLIVREALEKGIYIIAITDHNASANVGAVQKAATGTNLTVLPGMELQTREEVHLLCLFDTLEQLVAWQSVVDAHVPPMENNADLFGEQFVVDEAGEFMRRETRLLLTAANLSFSEAVEGVIKTGGIAIPAHVDRKTFGLIANLGFVPPDVPLAALEISKNLSPSEAIRRLPQIRGFPLIQSGDAHRLEEILGANEFTLAAPTVGEITLALQGRDGRSLVIRPLVGEGLSSR